MPRRRQSPPASPSATVGNADRRAVVPAGWSGVDRAVGVACLAAVVIAGVFRRVPVGRVLPFLAAGVALALLAALVGRSVDGLGDRLGAGATGVIQGALGNIPELLVTGFALHRGLITVVQATVVGSLLASVLLVLGSAFVAGGWRRGPQHIAGPRAREIAALLLVAVAILIVPTLVTVTGTPAAHHLRALSVICAVVLLAVFAASVPSSLQRSTPSVAVRTPGSAAEVPPPVVVAAAAPGAGGGAAQGSGGGGADRADVRGGTAPPDAGPGEPGGWPLRTAILTLVAASAGAALASDWFVGALQPALTALHVTPTFAGLVIVALAGNAVEQVAGVRLAARGRGEYALSLVLYSPLQIALLVAPLLVLAAPLLGAPGFTLALPPMLAVALVVSVLITAYVVVDGEASWLEGVVLIAAYLVLAAAFWWG